MVGGALQALAREPHSLAAKAMGGDGYSGVEHLLFLILDELRVANWQRSKDGQKNRNRPKRSSPLAQKPKKVGSVDEERSDADVAAMLARYGPQETSAPTEKPPGELAPVIDVPIDIAGNGAADGTIGGYSTQ